MPFGPRAIKVKYLRRMREILGIDMPSESDMVDFSFYFFPPLFNYFDMESGYLGSRPALRSATKAKRFDHMFARYRAFRVTVGNVRTFIWDNAGVLACLGESPVAFCGYTVTLLALPGVTASYDMSFTSRLFCVAELEFVVLAVSAFFRTVCYDVLPRYGSAMMRYATYLIGVTGLLGLRF